MKPLEPSPLHPVPRPHPLNMDNNRIPDAVCRIHLIAACGTGMGALAAMLKTTGFTVTGSDQNVYPPMSDFLQSFGVPVIEGFAAENLRPAPDLVVVGNAVVKTNPEITALSQTDIPFCSLPQAVNRFFGSGKKPLVVTGTHGKTTTSALLAWILETAGLQPTFLIGGILKNFDANFRVGSGEVVVLEGDEYDTAFFDKGPKFRHYIPHAAVLTGVEFDHADIFEDVEHITRVFDAYIDTFPACAALYAFDGNPRSVFLSHHRRCRVFRYGHGAGSAWRIEEAAFSPTSTRFQIERAGAPFGVFETPLPGRHNLENALAAVAVASDLGIPVQTIARALRTFCGVKRRQEIRGVVGGVCVMDDFAHHPTAVAETIGAVRAARPNERLVAVFEPRTNTSMRDVFQSVYPRAFDGADLVCVRAPAHADKIPPNRRFSTRRLVSDLNARETPALHFFDTNAVLSYLVNALKPGDVVLIMSNGGFDNIHTRLLSALGESACSP